MKLLRRQLQNRRIRRRIQLKRLAESKIKENTKKSSRSSKTEAGTSDMTVDCNGYPVIEYVNYESW